MPPLNTFSGAVIGAARGVNAMLTSQIEALKLKRQREQEDAAAERDDRALALREEEVGSLVRLRNAQIEQTEAIGGAITEEAMVKEMAWRRYRNGTHTQDDLIILGLRNPPRPGGAPTNMVEAAWAFMNGDYSQEEFDEFSANVRASSRASLQDRLFDTVMGISLNRGFRTEQRVKQQFGAVATFENVDVPMTPREIVTNAMGVYTKLLPMMEQLNRLPSDEDLQISIIDLLDQFFPTAPGTDPSLVPQSPGQQSLFGTGAGPVGQLPGANMSPTEIGAAQQRLDQLIELQNEMLHNQGAGAGGGAGDSNAALGQQPAVTQISASQTGQNLGVQPEAAGGTSAPR